MVGDRELFSGVDLDIGPGEVIGLIGPNGSGKSTLLRIIAGYRRPDAGTVAWTPTDAHVGYLDQAIDASSTSTVADLVAARTGVAAATRALELATEQVAAQARGAAEEYSHAWDAWLALGGATLDERSEAVLARVGLAGYLRRRLTSLSGGQQARAGLAALLLSQYDVYLLDEPTNDLDADGLDLLEAFVTSTHAAVVVVSHDREFLSRTTTSLIDIDVSLHRVTQVKGGYDAYLRERERRRQGAEQAYREYADQRAHLEARAARQREWSSSGVRKAGRNRRDNDKFIPHRHAEGSENRAGRAAQAEREIDRLDVVEEPRREWELRFRIAMAERSGDVVVSLRDVLVRYGDFTGDFTLGPVNAQIDRGDRIAVTGPNGAGKSTLVGLVTGRRTPDSGVVTLGAGVVIGEIDQARTLLAPGEVLVESMGRALPDATTSEVRTLLAKFGLGSGLVTRPAGQLSHGEMTRAALALLQARGVNTLVLDEPTNHLDLPAIEQLEQALAEFDGTLVLVTHDRRLLERVATTRRWVVTDGMLSEPRA